MDYMKQPPSFKLRKALRYVRLYGPGRTWMKVRGQYHVRKEYRSLPPSPSRRGVDGNVGVIGCGNFAYTTIGYYLRRDRGAVIRGCMDTNLHRAASFFERYRLHYYTDDAGVLLADPRIDLVYIASNHASHAEHAIEALRAGKSVHIEKPHCVSEDQLRRLCDVIRETDGRVHLGFNRPGSDFGRAVRRALESQQGSATMSWFVGGHQIDPDHWYFKKEEGGRVLGNLCHWTDFIYMMVPAENRFPITITPTSSVASDTNIVVTYVFGDGTVAALTFSARGHAFEGVRERFAAQKGDVLIFMNDFQSLVTEQGARKKTQKNWFRDHGHRRHILRSHDTLGRGGEEVSYIWETGLLFLKTREALERNATITIGAFSEESGSPPRAEA